MVATESTSHVQPAGVEQAGRDDNMIEDRPAVVVNCAEAVVGVFVGHEIQQAQVLATRLDGGNVAVRVQMLGDADVRGRIVEVAADEDVGRWVVVIDGVGGAVKLVGVVLPALVRFRRVSRDVQCEAMTINSWPLTTIWPSTMRRRLPWLRVLSITTGRRVKIAGAMWRPWVTSFMRTV